MSDKTDEWAGTEIPWQSAEEWKASLPQSSEEWAKVYRQFLQKIEDEEVEGSYADVFQRMTEKHGIPPRLILYNALMLYETIGRYIEEGEDIEMGPMSPLVPGIRMITILVHEVSKGGFETRPNKNK